MFRSIFFLLVGCWVFTLDTLWAQSGAFEKITIEQGLSQGMVFDMLQTRDGFLWVATKDGLNRYDGYNFKVFAQNPFDPFTLSDNTATTLFEDSRGLLWIATESKGVNVYDSRRGRFHHFPQLQAVAFSESRDGNLWVVTKGALFRLVIPDDWRAGLPEKADLSTLVPMQKIQVEAYAGPSERLTSIWPKEDGNFVLFSLLKHYEVSTKENMARPVGGPLLGGESHGAYQNGGHVWIVTDSCSVYYLHNGKTIRYAQSNNTRIGPINFDKDNQGRLWFSFKNLIWQLEPGKAPDFSKPDWTLDQDIKCLSVDRNGNLWVGTLGYGLRKINPKRQAFHSGVSGKSIWRVWRSPQGTYFWRSLVEIYTYDPKTGTYDKIFFPALNNAWKRDIAFDEDGSIWLLSTDKHNLLETLTAYDANGHIKQQYPLDINASYYSLLKRAQDGNFWITEEGPSLSCFDFRSNQTRRFDYSHLFGEKSAQVQTLAFAQDGNGDFWIGTQQGLVKCSMSSGIPQFQLMQTDPNNPKGLNHNTIACLLPDPVKPGERLWIGTKGGGINRLDIRSGLVSHYTTADGLPDMVVYGILPGNEDPKKGRPDFWCSTNRGLVKMIFPDLEKNDKKPVVTVFSAAKGLQGSEFNTQAFFKAANGELIFGGVNGLNHFFPEAVLPDTSRPPVFIVGISVNHEAVNLRQRGIQTSLDGLQGLHLDHDENNVSFEFAALDFTDPAQNRYRYRLMGVDDDWVETKGTRFAHFAHLSPGRYTFRVQGSNGEGGWQEASNPILLIIHPPWYRSNWAYLCYGLLLLWGAWWAYQLQIRRVKEREQLAFEHRETERVKALEQLKTNFFSNVTHEFRTPLTLIIEPLRLILQKAKDPEVLENAHLAEGNSQKLLGLVNQLLDMSKIESGQMTLDLRSDDLTKTVSEVFRRFLPLAEKRGVKLTFPSEDQVTFDKFSHVVYDAGKVELILNNLLSNALKFTPQGGAVWLTLGQALPERIKLSGNADTQPIVIRVSDTGIGIPAESLGSVFDRFYQVDSSHTRTGEGTGIGLSLSKELAELMGGGIYVESPNPESGDKGSSFVFWLPLITGSVQETAYDQQDTAGILPLNSSFESTPSSPDELPVALIIEDNPELRHFIRKSILSAGWQVFEASDGDEGIKKALEGLPDLIISDVMMPQKDGFEVCHTLKSHELTAHIPVILLTAKSAVESKIKGLRIGADDYLTKPFNTEELLVRMGNLVETRRRLREHYAQHASDTPARELAPEDSFPTELDRDFMRRFTFELDQHLSDESFSVEDFAKKMFVSRVQLHRKLKALTNQSVTDFMRAYRLDHAMVMLKNRKGNVGEVASMVGFGSESYFSRSFKDRFGISPSQVV